MAAARAAAAVALRPEDKAAVMEKEVMVVGPAAAREVAV